MLEEFSDINLREYTIQFKNGLAHLTLTQSKDRSPTIYEYIHKGGHMSCTWCCQRRLYTVEVPKNS